MFCKLIEYVFILSSFFLLFFNPCRLVNKKYNGVNAPASGFGEVGGSNGFIDYPDVCQFLTTGGVTQIFDRSTRAPYAFKNRNWITYDDDRSVAYKVTSENFEPLVLYLNLQFFLYATANC